ncbi:MAG: heterodisulfide reductase-related iron-sulfur binding cluster [Dehalococcoidia bacterium]
MASSTAWPAPAEAPQEADLAKCVHCGLCITACPTFVVTGLEVESPRGRIHLARSVAEGSIPLTAAVQEHWDLCLQCRACEVACPSAVPFGRIMEHARAQLAARPPRGRWRRRLRRAMLRHVVARPRVLALATAPVRLLGNSPLRHLARRIGILRLAPPLARGEAQLPRGLSKPFRPGRKQNPAPVVDERSQALLFTGCVMAELMGDVHRATIRVLERAGFAVATPGGQRCCGALHAHDGDLAFARKLARRNIDAFEEAGSGTIVVNSAGCGAAMKEYGDLLAGDPAYAERARRFAERVRDFSEVVPPTALRGARFAARVTYQDACHLAHVQRIREEPRRLLAALEGCSLVEAEGADMCCGAAGLYSLVQPAMSAELRGRKAAQFRAHRPEVIVTANPGCQMQYFAAVRDAGIDARVMHLAEVLDEATRRMSG